MARTPNYNFERKERERQKALKKAEKQAAKAARKGSETDDTATVTDGDEAGDDKQD